MEPDAEGSRALPDVRRGQLNGEARPRVQAVTRGREKRPRIGIASRDERAELHAGRVGTVDLPVLEGHETVQGRPEGRLVDGQVVARPLPRVGAAGHAVRPGHEDLSQVCGRALVHSVGDDHLVAPIRQAGQTRADRDNPRLVAAVAQHHFAPRRAVPDHGCSFALSHYRHSNRGRLVCVTRPGVSL